MQTYTSPAERAYFAPDAEWSKAAQAAFAVQKAFRAFSNEVDFLTGNRAEHTSEAISLRMHFLHAHTQAIRLPGDTYSAGMMNTISDDLKSDLRAIDRANIEFDGRDDIENLKQAVSEYAETIITALKAEMDTTDGDETEAEQFENNR